MKKQINPTIKAHLIRSAFYLLLLLAVCAIPFALAQSRSRGTNKQSPAKIDTSANKYMAQVSQRTDGAVSDQPLPNTSQTDQSQLPKTSNVVAAGPPIFVPINPLSAYDAEFSGDCWQLHLKLGDYVPGGKNYLKKVLTLPGAPK